MFLFKNLMLLLAPVAISGSLLSERRLYAACEMHV